MPSLVDMLRCWQPPPPSDAAQQAMQVAFVAYLVGLIWELASFPEAAAALCDAGAVEGLVHVVEHISPLVLSKGRCLCPPNLQLPRYEDMPLLYA